MVPLTILPFQHAVERPLKMAGYGLVRPPQKAMLHLIIILHVMVQFIYIQEIVPEPMLPVQMLMEVVEARM